MRALLLTVALIPFPALADTFETPSRVTAVTLYPWGASVTRRAEITLPAGVHEVILTDLPNETDAASLRVKAPEGLRMGAVNLQIGRLPPSDGAKSPAVQAAEDAVTAAEQNLADVNARIDAILLKAEAAQEQIAFLRNLGQADAAPGSDPRAMAQMVGAEALTALQAAHAAKAEARAQEPVRKTAEEALTKAQQALAALTEGLAPKAALTLSVQADAEGVAPIEVTTFTPTAHWAPVYDLHLSRLTGTPGLRLDRGVVIGQSSGEDWIGVDLTLSTARPADQAQPTELAPVLVQAGPPDQIVYDAAPKVAMAAAPMERMRDGFAETADLSMQGATVTWHYGNTVDIRNGVEDLRLRLGEATLTHTLVAEAVPLVDTSAYLVADSKNETGQVLLPGMATLYLDGAMVGQQSLDLTAEGEDLKLGFGPIDGLVLERVTPQKTAGERGFLTSSNQQVEEAVIRIRNQTAETWPVRLIDRVPFSEQNDVRVSFAADPAPETVDYDDKRGLLAWNLSVDPGATEQVTLTTTIDWPDGQVLR